MIFKEEYGGIFLFKMVKTSPGPTPVLIAILRAFRSSELVL